MTDQESSMVNNRRQGWVPPPVPQTVLPGALSAIRYKKSSMVDEITSEEKEMASHTSHSEQSEAIEPSLVGQEIASSLTKELVEDGIELPHANVEGIVETVQ